MGIGCSKSDGADLLYVLSTAYAYQKRVNSMTQRLREKEDAYISAWVEGERFASVLLGFTSTLSDLVRWEQTFCFGYQRLARRAKWREASGDSRCGSGNMTIKITPFDRRVVLLLWA